MHFMQVIEGPFVIWKCF